MLDAGFKPGEVAVVLAVVSLIIGFGAGLVRLAHAPQPLFILVYLSAVAFYAWTTANDARAATLFKRLHVWLIEDGSRPRPQPQREPDLSADDLRQAALRSVAAFTAPAPEPQPALATARAARPETETANEEARAVSL